jgi:hypothetical protein
LAILLEVGSIMALLYFLFKLVFPLIAGSYVVRLAGSLRKEGIEKLKKE